MARQVARRYQVRILVWPLTENHSYRKVLAMTWHPAYTVVVALFVVAMAWFVFDPMKEQSYGRNDTPNPGYVQIENPTSPNASNPYRNGLAQ